jgi:uncharacterized protein (DUF2461 family)
MNNNRDRFLEHKKNYVNYLYEPMKALGKELFEPFLEKPGNVLKVSRIYRDARMHHATPYKESLWVSIRQDVDWWAENPCLYFEITPDEVSYGLIWYKPRVSAMTDFRQAIAARPEPFLTLIAETEAATGVPVTAKCYKRPKEAPSETLAPYFAWKEYIACIVEEPICEATFGPELGQRAKAFLEKLIPLYEYCNQFKV